MTTYDTFDEFNADVRAARREYEMHPLANSPHGSHCARLGCPIAAAKNEYWRLYQAKRYAERKKK